MTRQELIDDGQEEVFSRSAVERGMDRDPLAIAPEETRAAELAEALMRLAELEDFEACRRGAQAGPAFEGVGLVADRYGLSREQLLEAVKVGSDWLQVAKAALGSSS